MHNSTIEEVLALALRLEHRERLQLIERIASSVEQELDADVSSEALSETEHWGKSLNKLLDEFGPIELVDPEIEDPVEWVKHQRAKRLLNR
jgi:hypothetical protein